jgi:hypothetical protein
MTGGVAKLTTGVTARAVDRTCTWSSAESPVLCALRLLGRRAAIWHEQNPAAAKDVPWENTSN